MTGPVTVFDETLTVGDNSASLTVPWTDAADAYTVTLLPPSNTTVSTVAVAQHGGRCLDDTNSGECVDLSEISTEARAEIHQWACDPASELTRKKYQNPAPPGHGLTGAP